MTGCNQEAFAFTAHFSRRVEAAFTAGQVSSDGGSLLLREVDLRIDLGDLLVGKTFSGQLHQLGARDGAMRQTAGRGESNSSRSSALRIKAGKGRPGDIDKPTPKRLVSNLCLGRNTRYALLFNRRLTGGA
jgi:hypothetical protein